MGQIFITHSKRDLIIRNFFANLFGTTRVKGIFKEIEGFRTPDTSGEIEWDIQSSSALFVLLGPQMNELHHTRDWCVWESGKGKEIWVFEPYEYLTHIDVVIPHLDHYVPYNLQVQFQGLIRRIIESYDDEDVLPTALGMGAGCAFIGGGLGFLIELLFNKEGHIPIAGPLIGASVGGVLGGMGGGSFVAPIKNRPIGLRIECPSCHQRYIIYTKPHKLRCPCCNVILRL